MENAKREICYVQGARFSFHVHSIVYSFFILVLFVVRPDFFCESINPKIFVTMEESINTFYILNQIDVSQDVKMKDERRGLTYLPWAKAWAHLMSRYPDSTYKVYENAAGLPYFSDGHTAFVKVGATVKGIEHVEFLAVMDHRNQSITVEHLTSVDVVKSIQRCLVKAIARHGLGLYIYSGEDLPDEYRENETARTWEELSSDIEQATTRDALTGIWNANKHLHGNKKFKDALTEKGKELKND